jgi:hypothetical protein
VLQQSVLSLLLHPFTCIRTAICTARFYLLGFSLDMPGLLDSIAAAEALGATVHYKSQEQVLQALLDDLGLPADPAAAAAAGAAQLPASAAGVVDTAAAAAADAAAAGAAADEPTAAAAADEGAAGEDSDDDVVDLTAEDIGDTFCQAVVLVPEHTSPERLQELLGPQLPVWQLLASKVVFFMQSSCKGPLSWLRRKHRQQQQREQQAAAGTGLGAAGGSKKRPRSGSSSSVPKRRRRRQCSGGWQQEWLEEGELLVPAGEDGGDSSSNGGLTIRLPVKLRPYQLFGNGVAVLMETIGLSSVSKAQLQQLLALLAQGQALQVILESTSKEKQNTEVHAYSAMVAGAPSRHVSTAFCCMVCCMVLTIWCPAILYTAGGGVGDAGW